ncbi:lysylphosphatidylglycerol synthase transmembrane domain-containing protein [Luteolibacter sp. SL250]|uniref:lysylphosphatidylglycerol synthase transmembrane domain-containing protein n=1 Tax=Luteolibacter sp. SL250 TaxID=2995170 RepID=UPI00226DF2E5|nr:lysylphosphatidylglycerol synthase transmembrane domain-containing protein [Luteolibacter sp. SL250]WAC19454.1 lysylphosphatidylglycerol synthase transmembrane domain-containing protein [Luteolibacter sp. SL250]
MKAALIFLLKLALTVACLWWAFSGIDGKGTILARPGDIHYGWLSVGVGIAGISMVLSALRWWVLMRVLDIRVGIARTIELTMIGNLLSLFSIGSLGGDAAKVILLNRDHPGKKLPVTMSVLIDHMAGMVSIGLLFFFMSVRGFEELTSREVLGAQGENILRLAWLYIGGGFLLVALFFLCASPPLHRRIHANGRMDRWPIMRRIPEIYDTYRRNWKLTLAGLGFSMLMMLTYFASFWCGLRAVGGEAALGPFMTAMPVIDGLSSIPVSISGIGIRENLFMMLMPALADVSKDIARDSSLAGFACNVLWAVLGALFFLKRRDRISVKEMKEV